MLSADAAAPHRPTSNSDLCLTFVQLVLFCQLLLHPICLAERAIDWHMEVVKVTCHHYQGVELIERYKNDGEGRYFIVQCGCWSRQHYRWDFAAETNSSSFYICSTACHYACLRPSPTWSGSLLALLWTTVTTTTLTLYYCTFGSWNCKDRRSFVICLTSCKAVLIHHSHAVHVSTAIMFKNEHPWRIL